MRKVHVIFDIPTCISVLLGVLESAIMLTSNECLTAKYFQQGYHYHKLRKAFSKFYCRLYKSISKFNDRIKTLLREGLS